MNIKGKKYQQRGEKERFQKKNLFIP
ncbi:unnamed protein product [Spirodela intermedia]|uniref:Uncharacterized protein n=2 Tax=Spirodela intermedia TaxID=51605 RepID=A0A7I8K362_SPIIN|nr:unnamed protein product [Spirodela intermedia]CAA6656100.1 unnamed protein product [Spirodela intermedia]CAA7391546.1 unnamed protein product [Spirodela intermedia]